MPPRLRVLSLPSPIDTALPRNLSSCLQFSTTTRLRAAPAKGKSGKQAQQPVNKKGKKFVLATRKDRDVSRNAPNPGERRAWKNRIVLSNINANDVSGLRPLTPENMANEQTLGKVMSIPGDAVDSLRSLRAFKRTQAWASYKKPAVLMTEESWNLAKLMTDIQNNSQSGPSSIAKVIHGPRRSGKSVFLLQALLMGILQKWIVINIPECEYTPQPLQQQLT
jgi:small subunit ribosomal protein S29